LFRRVQAFVLVLELLSRIKSFAEFRLFANLSRIVVVTTVTKSRSVSATIGTETSAVATRAARVSAAAVS
jgi:hypothetical protein